MGSIHGRVIPKTITMVHNASLLGTQDVTISKTFKSAVLVRQKSWNFFWFLNLWTLTKVDVWQHLQNTRYVDLLHRSVCAKDRPTRVSPSSSVISTFFYITKLVFVALLRTVFGKKANNFPHKATTPTVDETEHHESLPRFLPELDHTSPISFCACLFFHSALATFLEFSVVNSK